MKRVFSLFLAGLAVTLLSCASTAQGTSEELIEAAMADPGRSDADRERDARSRPEAILRLLDIGPGDTVADIFGGGGYYADLIAGVVGPEGRVILQNNTPYSKFVLKTLEEKYGDDADTAVEVLISEVDDLQLEPGSLDAALMVMSFHDLYYYAPDRGWFKTDVPLFLEQVHAALKPGGRLVIVDHAAAAGTGKTAAQDIHRIDEQFAQAEIEAAGFELVDTSEILRNPNDDKSKMVFDKSVRGKTDRFVLAFTR